MSGSLFAILSVPVMAAGLDDAAIELRYSGALTRVARDADDAVVKRFNLYCLLTRQESGSWQLAFALSERGGGSWPWPERFGALQFDRDLKPGASRGMRLLYEHEGSPAALPLATPIVGYASSLRAGATWGEGTETWEVAGTEKKRDRNCWKVQVSGRLGRKRTVWVDVERPIVVAFEERVFVGQGDEHALTLQIESQKSLLPEQRDRDQRVIDRLLALQKALDRPDNEFRAELNAAQLKLASEALPELRQLANDTPFSALVTAISRDVDAQAMRNSEVARLADRFVGQQAPEFSLTLLDKTQVTREKLNGRLVVLHFWDYQGEPLVEPYGQVGYLDFLYGRRRKLGVDVFGVAVDSRLKDEQSAPAAIKSFQRLREFMKLSYPLAADDGGLLAKFGDPPKFGARLPLWVVIDEAGRIVHYHSGYYKINPDEGLRDLDDVLVNAIRARQTGSGKPGE